MLWSLEPGWLMMTVATVSALAFFFGSALDAIMHDDGFGSTGNTVLFTIGFFGSVLIANHYGVNLRDLKAAVGYGLAGAFVLVGGLALLKAGLQRF
jgi:hypothetical protein